jgi:hypothetical protein
MGRLRRFADHRFVGLRDTMLVYDCDDDGQFAELEERAADLEGQNAFQTFGPDALVEAVNRGFRAAGVPTPESDL